MLPSRLSRPPSGAVDALRLPGPRLDSTNPRYYRHPPAASAPLFDGAPLDSGSAHVLHNNVSHLAVENTRLLGHFVGPGDNLPADPFAGYGDATPSDGAFGVLSWAAPINGCVFGPFAASFTELGTNPPGYKPRRVRVIVEILKGTALASDVTLGAALTTGPGTPSNAPVIASAYVVSSQPGSGGPPTPPVEEIHVLDLEADAPQRPGESWRSADGESTVVLPLWVWVGWRSTVPGADAILSASAWEINE